MDLRLMASLVSGVRAKNLITNEPILSLAKCDGLQATSLRRSVSSLEVRICFDVHAI